MASWLKAVVIDKTQWNPRLFSLRVQISGREEPESNESDAQGPGADAQTNSSETPDFSFTAGQFVRVGLDIDGERVARPYPLVNVPDTDYLEIYFNIVPEGPLSPKLAELNAGEELYIAERANGFLVVNEVPECRHLWMLATGTGVGPFLSILGSGDAWKRFDKVVLAYCVRDQSELSYSEQIAELAGEYADNFSFVPLVTRESVDGALNQRITDAIRDGSMEDLAGIRISADESHVMMCGNSDMISDVSELLVERGMKKHLRRDPGHYTTEKYH